MKMQKTAIIILALLTLTAVMLSGCSFPNPQPVCGDKVCEAGESCIQDCGPQPANASINVETEKNTYSRGEEVKLR